MSNNVKSFLSIVSVYNILLGLVCTADGFVGERASSKVSRNNRQSERRRVFAVISHACFLTKSPATQTTWDSIG